MSEGLRNGTFGLGLLIGIGISFLFGLVVSGGGDYCPAAPCSAETLPYPNPFTPITEAKLDTTTKELATLDLKAQESMARATNWIAWLTLATVLTGTVGTGLLIWNLSETRATTKAAQRSNELLAMEQRPWLDFNVENFGKCQIQTQNGIPVGFLFFPKIKLINQGKGVAQSYDIRTAVHLGKSFSETGIVEGLREKATRHLNNSTPIFPDHSITRQNVGAPCQVNILPGKNDNADENWWLTILVVYRSANGTVHHTAKFFSAGFSQLPQSDHERDNHSQYLNDWHEWEWLREYV